MRSLDPQVQALVNEVARAWDAFKAERKGAEARARALIEAEVAQAVESKRSKVSEALRVALEGGATKVALKAVTTKDRRSFDALLPAPTVVEEVPEPEYLKLERVGDLVRVTLDPANVVDTSYDRTDPRPWSGDFEIFTRPLDGKQFADPVMGREYPDGYGVAEWVHEHPGEEDKILEWAQRNPC